MEQETKHVSTNLVVVKIRSSPSFSRDSGAKSVRNVAIHGRGLDPHIIL